ncbi:hypothetical protein MSAN_00465900 [Mycena sanguinolenta]|uniref:Methyltransferase domain-containing protein n=1 Tax=Mycena sanguinolenta TaxID=230812 RepID=A0A8H7DKK4_9AGAR|nr:hypothetical protein MSAN_00465900 [Mycena sanguinolenta]
MARLSLWHLPVTFLLLTVLYLLARQQAEFPGSSPSSAPPPPPRCASAASLYARSGARRCLHSPHRALGRTTSGTSTSPPSPAPFPVFRVGVMGDGGKWVCGLERATHHPNCVIYSMGVERQSSFEQEMLHQSKDCQIWGFDFSVSEWGPELRADTAVNARAHFFPYKIGAADNHTADPKEYSLQGIMKELGHEFIDVWKIDIEGSEFRALKAVIESFKGQPLPFGQMQIEIHVDFDPDHVNTIGEFDEWWTMLEDAGLRPFWTELNVLDANIYRRGPYVSEWSFINIRGKHALLDDTLPDHPWLI